MELQALADTAGTYAERHKAARVAIGKSLIGEPVSAIRLGGKDYLVALRDLETLPKDVKTRPLGVLSACDDQGVIAVETLDA
jgi:hypothetical protein